MSELPYDPLHRKRQILITDDEEINRELLSAMLSDKYDILLAENGEEALKQIHDHKDTLSLILLDLIMPVLSGTDVLSSLRENPLEREIPVIVLTSEQDAEIESLQLGATDFISKPYPQAGVVRARIQRTIELFEDRRTIRSTERDPLTGLYNRSYFFSFIRDFDSQHPDADMDALVLDINRFHILKERYGKAYADDIIRRLSGQLRMIAGENRGIACRLESDTFYLYCPNGIKYQHVLDSLAAGLEDGQERRIHIRMGVYPHADLSVDASLRFERARLAADSIRNSFYQMIGVYDDKLHQEQLYEDQLIEDFQKALSEHQFLIYYQPKYDVTGDKPRLASAEALVRWKHPTLGMISPGRFIPLFEGNGMIQQLDSYVWEETARQIAAWRKQYGITIPVSVNVSRVDMYDPSLVSNLLTLVENHGLHMKDLMLEITESAYTHETGQIIDMAFQLRHAGFRIEMDDFGTGYSSLSMLSNLPIDALKLDMQFVRHAFEENTDTQMIQVILGIARHLNVPVIAEGVETEYQCSVLKDLGCQLIQGYYFSKPVPPSEFEVFLRETYTAPIPSDIGAPSKDAAADTEQESQQHEGSETEKDDEKPGIHLKLISIVFLILAIIVAGSIFVSDLLVARGNQDMQTANSHFISANLAAMDLRYGSDYLTDRVRCFVITRDKTYLDDYFHEAEVTRTRDLAVETLRSLKEDETAEAYQNMATALSYSNELMKREYTAMLLVASADGLDPSTLPASLLAQPLSEEFEALSAPEKLERARSMVFDNVYRDYKTTIYNHINDACMALVRETQDSLTVSTENIDRMISLRSWLTTVLLIGLMIYTLYISTQVIHPLMHLVDQMKAQKKMKPAGAEELRFVTRTYNTILEKNQETYAQLSYKASHDALTGLYNRSAYQMFIESVDLQHIALILVDVDDFKSVNDTYGHDMGDRMLKRVASILRSSFRSVDYVCRIGGDEFAIIMTRANSTMHGLIREKIRRANEQLMHPEDNLPPTSLSVGVAFSDRPNPSSDIFHDADTALYRVKAGGRCGCLFHE